LNMNNFRHLLNPNSGHGRGIAPVGMNKSKN
jgi:hypothetical protein